MEAISDILKKIDSESDKFKRGELLAKYVRTNQGVMKTILLAYEPNLKFNLPDSPPPYKPCEAIDQQAMLYNAMNRMYLWLGEGNPAVTKTKREVLFIQMLESLHPGDAVLMCHVINKKLPYKNISEDFVREVFPSLLSPRTSELVKEPTSVQKDEEPAKPKPTPKPKKPPTPRKPPAKAK